MIQVADVDPPMIDSVAWLPDSVRLLCTDISFILNNDQSWQDPNYKYYLGGPIFRDNCTELQISVNDFVLYGDCDTAFAKLYRTFFATDAF